MKFLKEQMYMRDTTSIVMLQTINPKLSMIEPLMHELHFAVVCRYT
ncbi:hypothetical protein Hdeb2414_s0002g00068441 [Helianthus debilis subsp. tardiflorus]